MRMSQELKENGLPKVRARYKKRSREGKSRMIDELCEDQGYERKYAIKLLNDALPAPSGQSHAGPLPQYDAIEPIVKQLWLAAEQPCGKRLVPILRPMGSPSTNDALVSSPIASARCCGRSAQRLWIGS